MSHPFRFGLMAQGGSTVAEVTTRARRAEELGYYSILYNDHYLGPGAAMTSANHSIQASAAIPTAVLAATATERLVIGFRVLSVDYHNPVVLAKELATIDVFSGGRLEVGMGAGWVEAEYAGMGIRYDRPGIRIARLGEAVEVLRACFGEGEVDVRGEHVHASGFSGVPKPVGRVPIAIGGGGPKILQLAARKADIVAFNVSNAAGKLTADGTKSATATAVSEKVDIVRQAAGERFGDLQLEIGNYFTFVTDDVAATAATLSERTRGVLDMPLDEVLEHPHALLGDIDQICDTLEKRRELYGFNYITVRETEIETFAPIVDRLAGR
ncbi:TIGR03621 family F420-dependent LLM class oxidoreductase [Blastococcus sp. URHD0036]|uniref:TIGR03621 family F420-dependent LLM class oxidoreductase n=1 Tax=Blastococcus sp. URHD0036 TaxID=1380356 RepID=UPI000496A277|nr:TIGR03621 family F420-dependent LLM class oxidoreductase [Blastococcus sp. URHD0036]